MYFHKNLRWLIVTSTVAALSLVALGGTALADEDPNQTSGPTIESSIPIDENAMPIELNQFIAELMNDIPDSSYTWDQENKAVIAYVHTQDDAALLGSLVNDSSYADSISIEISEYSFLELENLAHDVVSTGLEGNEIFWAAPEPDGSGIAIGMPEELKSSRRAASDLSRSAGVPVRVVYEEPPMATSRFNDGYQNERNGGALMNRANPQPGAPNNLTICTTAFGVRNSINGSPAMLTADHCGPTNSLWRVGLLVSPNVGTMKATANDGTDIKLIQDPNIFYNNYIYWGPNTSNSIVRVSGYKVPIVGDVVCHSGSLSGTVCGGATISNTNVTVSYSGGLTYSKMFMTYLANSIGSAGPGDSGGPVVAINSDGTSVAAVGIISGVGDPGSTPCQGIQDRQCSNITFVAPISSYFAKYPNSYLP